MPRRSANEIEISIESYAHDLHYFHPSKKKRHIEPGSKLVTSRQYQRHDWARHASDIDSSDTALDIVERSMDIQQILYELALHVNAYFRFQALIVIMTAFVLIVFDCYYLILEFTTDTHSFRLSREDTLIFLFYELATNAINVLILVIACTCVTKVAHRTGRIVHKIIIATQSQALRQRLMQFSLQLNFNQPNFTAFGLFTIDATLMYTIAGATTTYLVILVQFNEPPKPGENQLVTGNESMT